MKRQAIAGSWIFLWRRPEFDTNLIGMSDRHARIYVIANQKGGVGKTTTAMNLACAIAREGKRVLLVDSDAQANLTSYLGVTPRRTLDELYLAKKPMDRKSLLDLVHESGHGVSLIPSDASLNGVEYYLFSKAKREQVLASALQELRADFDFVLIDTPPSLNLLTLNALVAADGVIIPVQPEFFSLEGIVKIRESITDVRERWNPRLEIRGILVTQANARRKLTNEVISTLRQEFEDRVFATLIRENTAVTESSGQARSVLDYAPSSNGALDYFALGREFLQSEVNV